MAGQRWIKASRSCGCLYVLQSGAVAIGTEEESLQVQ